MNNDDFLAALADRLDPDHKDAVAELAASLSDIISDSLQNTKNVSLKGFGLFEVKKEKEHIVVKASIRQRLLVPPALTVCFHPDESITNKIN